MVPSLLCVLCWVVVCTHFSTERRVTQVKTPAQTPFSSTVGFKKDMKEALNRYGLRASSLEGLVHCGDRAGVR